jgi:hypothetical protein
MKMWDAELVELYDDAVKNTQLGVVFYREELAQRAADSASAAMEDLARTSMRLLRITSIACCARPTVADQQLR